MSRKGSFDFKEKLAALKKLKRTLPREVGEITANFFQDNFTKQGFDDNGVNPWKQVRRRIAGTPEYKYPKKKDLGRRTRAILVKSGKLRRDIKVRKARFDRIEVGTSRLTKDYASRHNYGEDKMPKRKFIGNSRNLKRKQKSHITNRLDKILGRFNFFNF